MTTSAKPVKTGKKRISTWRLLRNRLIAGLFVVLPLFITYFVIRWLYDFLTEVLIGPISNWLLSRWYPDGQDLPFAITHVAGPVAALFLVLGFLFIAGMFFNSRVHRFMDWFLHNVPGVNLVYSVVSNVFSALRRSQNAAENFKRVVLVEFPHPGMKVPAFVTSETRDQNTGEDILCVYVPTTPVPTSGYMLLVPESDVVPLDWGLQDTLQAIVSGGITTPEQVVYYQPAKLRAAALSAASLASTENVADELAAQPKPESENDASD